jgi:hypothetical protein
VTYTAASYACCGTNEDPCTTVNIKSTTTPTLELHRRFIFFFLISKSLSLSLSLAEYNEEYTIRNFRSELSKREEKEVSHARFTFGCVAS